MSQYVQCNTNTLNETLPNASTSLLLSSTEQQQIIINNNNNNNNDQIGIGSIVLYHDKTIIPDSNRDEYWIARILVIREQLYIYIYISGFFCFFANQNTKTKQSNYFCFLICVINI